MALIKKICFALLVALPRTRDCTAIWGFFPTLQMCVVLNLTQENMAQFKVCLSKYAYGQMAVASR